MICAGSIVHTSGLLLPSTVAPERTTRVFPAGLRMGDMFARLNEFHLGRIVGNASITEELCALEMDGRQNITPNT